MAFSMHAIAKANSSDADGLKRLFPNAPESLQPLWWMLYSKLRLTTPPAWKLSTIRPWSPSGCAEARTPPRVNDFPPAECSFGASARFHFSRDETLASRRGIPLALRSCAVTDTGRAIWHSALRLLHGYDSPSL